MEEYEKLDEEAEALDKQISALWAKRDAITREADKQYMKYAEKDVGRCFKSNVDGDYVKIIDTPYPKKYSWHYEINRYEYPALYIHDFTSEEYSGLPFDFGRISVQDYTGDMYTEISKAEFDWKFWIVVDELAEAVDIDGDDEEDE